MEEPALPAPALTGWQSMSVLTCEQAALPRLHNVAGRRHTRQSVRGALCPPDQRRRLYQQQSKLLAASAYCVRVPWRGWPSDDIGVPRRRFVRLHIEHRVPNLGGGQYGRRSDTPFQSDLAVAKLPDRRQRMGLLPKYGSHCIQGPRHESRGLCHQLVELTVRGQEPRQRFVIGNMFRQPGWQHDLTYQTSQRSFASGAWEWRSRRIFLLHCLGRFRQPRHTPDGRCHLQC